MINHILINLQNNPYQTKPYKKTDSKSINAPNSANKPFKSLKNKNNFKKKKIKKRENNLKNKSKKKINELSNLSTKSFNKGKNSKNNGSKERLNSVQKLINGIDSEFLNSMDLTTGNVSKSKTPPKPKSSKKPSKKSCSVTQALSC